MFRCFDYSWISVWILKQNLILWKKKNQFCNLHNNDFNHYLLSESYFGLHNMDRLRRILFFLIVFGEFSRMIKYQITSILTTHQIFWILQKLFKFLKNLKKNRIKFILEQGLKSSWFLLIIIIWINVISNGFLQQQRFRSTKKQALDFLLSFIANKYRHLYIRCLADSPLVFFFSCFSPSFFDFSLSKSPGAHVCFLILTLHLPLNRLPSWKKTYEEKK